MAVYLAVIVLEFVAYAFSMNFKEEQQNKMFLVLGSIPIILVSALRYKTIGGNDPLVYYNHYQSALSSTLEQLSSQSRMEYGYHVFVKILSTTFHDPQWIFFWSALIFTVCVAYFIQKNSKDPFLSLWLYYTMGSFSFSLCGLRQTIAMSLCLVSIEFIKKRWFIPFVLMVLLASQFHITAVIFLPLYFLAGMKITPLNLFANMIIAGGVMLFMNEIVGFANTSFDMNFYTPVSSGGFITVIIYLLVFALVFFNRKELFKERSNSIAFMLACVGLLTYIMRYFATQATERISFYFFYMIIILIPNAIQSMKEKKDRQVFYLLIIILSLALFIYRTAKSVIYPYTFFWEVL